MDRLHVDDRPIIHREEPEEAVQVWKAVALHLMGCIGLPVVNMNQDQVRVACNLIGDYEPDEAGGLTVRNES